MESTSCLLALKPSLYNYSPIHNHYFSSREQPPSTLLQSRPGKHPLSAHLLSAHLRSCPGKAPTFRAPPYRPKSTPTSATGFREPPYKLAWPRETTYTTITVFPVVSVLFNPNYPARAGIPLWLGGLTSTFRTQAHKSLYLQHRSLALLIRASDQSPSLCTNHHIRSLIT